MEELYERFGLTTDLESEIGKFRTKIYNLLASSELGSDVLDDDEDNITWRFANCVGEGYDHPDYISEKVHFMLSSSLTFNEFLFRLQIIFNLLWESRAEIAKRLSLIIEGYFDESALNLGYFVRIYKRKSPQILPAGSKRQKDKIMSTFNRLEAKPGKYSSVMEHYEAGIKELLSAKTKAQLKDVIEDMSTACDALAKVSFKDDNVGFKHFFKNERWKTVKLNDVQKKYTAISTIQSTK